MAERIDCAPDRHALRSIDYQFTVQDYVDNRKAHHYRGAFHPAAVLDHRPYCAFCTGPRGAGDVYHGKRSAVGDCELQQELPEGKMRVLGACSYDFRAVENRASAQCNDAISVAVQCSLPPGFDDIHCGFGVDRMEQAAADSLPLK